MDLNFTNVTYDGDLSDFSEEQLRELVREYEDAQDSNAAEFETAAEAIDEIDSSTIEDFEQARTTLIEEITGAEAFDEVPLTEDALEDSDFSELRDWRDFVAGQDDPAGDKGDKGSDGDVEFDDMGTQSEVEGEDADFDIVEEELDGIPGVNAE